MVKAAKENLMDKKKMLYKSESNKVLAGVCGGIADYFGISATIVRVVWFIVTWCYGAGLLIYIGAALILKTESEVRESAASNQQNNQDEWWTIIEKSPVTEEKIEEPEPLHEKTPEEIEEEKRWAEEERKREKERKRKRQEEIENFNPVSFDE